MPSSEQDMAFHFRPLASLNLGMVLVLRGAQESLAEYTIQELLGGDL